MRNINEIDSNIKELRKEYERLIEVSKMAALTEEERFNYFVAEHRLSCMIDSFETAKQTGRESGMAEGMAEGRAEGLEEGRAEGRAEGINEGRAKGLEEGRAEGLEEGRTEGLEEGRAKGITEGRKEMAKSLKAQGIDLAIISNCTKLSIAEISCL